MADDFALIDGDVSFEKLKFKLHDPHVDFFEQDVDLVVNQIAYCLEWAGAEIFDIQKIKPYNFHFTLNHNVLDRNILAPISKKFFDNPEYSHDELYVQKEDIRSIKNRFDNDKPLVLCPFLLSPEAEEFLFEQDLPVSFHDMAEWANIARLCYKLYAFGFKKEILPLYELLLGKRYLSQKTIERIMRLKDANEKGKRFEGFIRRLFNSIKNFSVTDGRKYTSAGEFDIYVKNDRADGVLSKFGPSFFIECKNLDKKISPEEINHFPSKLKKKKVNGIIITTKGITTKGKYNAMTCMEEARESGIEIVALDKSDLIKMINMINKGEDAAKIIIEKYHEQIRF